MPRGDGVVYQASDGRWRGSLYAPTPNGGTRRIYVSGTTRADAAAKLRKVRRARDLGQLTATETHTVGSWLTRWLERTAAPRLRPRTLDTYTGYLTRHVIPTLGRLRLDRLTPDHLEDLYATLAAPAPSGAGLAPASVLQVHRILSTALKEAERRHGIRNPALLVHPPSAKRPDVRPLTAGQARAILDAAAGQRLSARWSVALALGLRQGEVLGLSWDDVDLDEGVLRVRRALQRQRWKHGCAQPVKCRAGAAACPGRVGGGLMLVDPKTRAGKRTMPLPATLAKSLREHRIAQLRERVQDGPNWRPWVTQWGGESMAVELVFAQRSGSPIDPRADWKAWKMLLTAAGVRGDVRLHDARHTAATLMLAQGVPARVVMEILGHSQISLTLGTYSHVDLDLMRTAAARVDDVLWGDTSGGRV